MLGDTLARFTPRCKETTSPGGEWVAAFFSAAKLQLAAEATEIQSDQTPATFCRMSQKNPTQWQALRVTIRN